LNSLYALPQAPLRLARGYILPPATQAR